MNIITALGNEENCKKIKNKINSNIIGTDIQYKEAVVEILEKNDKIDLLILSSILPGELNIYEFINIIKYKKPNLEIIIILEKEDEKLNEFIVSKGITNIYYNNKITFDEIILKISEIENKNKINNKIEELEKIVMEKNNRKIIKKEKNIKDKIKEKINKMNNKKNIVKNKKIISIIGAPKVGKTIFILILSLIKSKKILIVECNNKKNDIQVIIGKKRKENDSMIKWKKNIDILFVLKKKENNEEYLKIEDKILKESNEYDYIFFDIEDIEKNKKILIESNQIILLLESNLLGIKETREILLELMRTTNNRKDNIKIIYNKHTSTSIKREILNMMFIDFKIIGKIQYDKNYNIFINSNTKFVAPKIKKQYEKIKDGLML